MTLKPLHSQLTIHAMQALFATYGLTKSNLGVCSSRPLIVAALFAKITCGVILLATLTAAQADNHVRLVAFGDSLIAGYGLPVEDGFVAQLEKALTEKGHTVEIFNAGVSGDTTAGGLDRVDWVLSEQYSGVILHLGHNDAFRGIPVDVIHSNLDAMIASIKQRGLPVLLTGAMAPRNLGADYYLAFDAIYPQLAEKHDLVFYPFFLEGVATNPDLNQDDGIHPNQSGVAYIVEQLLPYVDQLIERIK